MEELLPVHLIRAVENGLEPPVVTVGLRLELVVSGSVMAFTASTFLWPSDGIRLQVRAVKMPTDVPM